MASSPATAISMKDQCSEIGKTTDPSSMSMSTLCREAEAMAAPNVVHSNYVPAALQRHLQFLQFNADGHLVVGCSDLTGRMWTGSLWYFRDPKDAPIIQKALTGVDCDSGCVDGRFIGDKKKDMLVVFDDGTLQYVTLSFSDEHGNEGQEFQQPSKRESFFFFGTNNIIQEHDDIITGIDITSDNRKAVTSSSDKTVVALDINTFKLETRLIDVHENLISDVGTNRINPNVIATSANDGVVATWDMSAAPNSFISRIYNNPSDWPTCVEWLPNSEHHILVGNQSGEIILFDVRKCGGGPKDSVFVCKTLENQVHRIAFSSRRQNLFAVSGDTYSLKVLELDASCSNLALRHENNNHDDFIRGMAWHPHTDNLFTCGWDQKVICSTV